MSDKSTSASQERHGDDREEIARLLPAPAEWELPREQHLRHKELLMQHIDREQATSPRRSRRLLRPAVLAPATALALAGALTAGVALTGDNGKAGAGGQQTAADARPAAALLHQISDAAGKQDPPHVSDDQFVYTRTKSQGAELASGKAVMEPLKESESWTSQKPGPQLKLGLVKSDGETWPINAQAGDTKGTPPGLYRPTYRWLSSLPTDPDKLLKYLYAKTRKVEAREQDQAVFEQIGSLLGGLMPPRTSAALYQAAAKIEGVTRAPKAHDALGRTGLGIARNDTRNGYRTEWVFDKQDYSFLGSRSYLIKDRPYGKSGTLMSSSAELAHGVADKAGQRPTAPETTRMTSGKS
ncbi:CU044_5270 family protein [Streptomyces axinellae]|uniref:CU044_5270 family protein n=1 Tax=Streptomyces axinellae TaxID=552788 RepID=A0ABN3Q2X6_9ACTN